MSRSPRKKRQGGFTILEVLAAIIILTIGATAVAGLAGVLLTRGRQSKYMTLAATLASEKLEDLSHWPSNASTATGVDLSSPQICVPSPATTEGSLSSNVTTSITCNGNTATVSYFDYVSIDITDGSACLTPGAGCFAETTSSTVSGVTTYYTTYHSPNGQIAPPSVTGSTTAPANFSTFQRNWLIEANTPVASTQSAGVYIPGTRRITVLVTLLQNPVPAGTVPPPTVSYQMSMVRP